VRPALLERTRPFWPKKSEGGSVWADDVEDGTSSAGYGRRQCR
jgi:hypothetical protein